MLKAILAIALCLAAQTARADHMAGDPAKVLSFSRDTILVGDLIVDGVTGAWTIYALSTGTSSGLGSGLTILATAPAIVFGSVALSQDSSDGAMWVATLAAGAIFTVAMVDVLRIDRAPSEHVGTFSQNLLLVPRIEPLPTERSTRYGLALAGTF